MSRFVPTRAGVINLWDYRDEEFVFADGWLVLRGPNGSGKTKALEVLFPFVLDGRIEPRRLNPFASEDRTMKSNLLYRGQESALAYVWLEFGNGEQYVTVGIGLRAQRHNDKVTRWYFVADGRVGVDFALLDDEDRPIVRKHLVSQLGAEAVSDNAEEHRAAIDARLFGLGRERYEQLLNLVLTLRKPQLAKNLDPISLSNTLADGLRPIDEELLAEAARSFDDMEAVQLTLDGLISADEATRAFLAIYTTYLRTHARAAADKLTDRRAKTRAFEEALTSAAAQHEEAKATLATAQDALAGAVQEPLRLRAHLDRLRLSDVYKSQGQLADLERIVGELAKAVRRADDALAGQRRQTASRQRELASASQALADREAELSRLARNLATDAEAAGIVWQPQDFESAGLHERASARVTARRDDISSVRQAVTHLDRARHDRTRAATALTEAQAAMEKAQAAELLAAQAVEQARAEAFQKLDVWAQRHADLMTVIGEPGLMTGLRHALASTGEPDESTLQAVFAASTGPAVQNLRDLLGRLRAEKSILEERQRKLGEERAAVAAERDDAPAPWFARPAAREDRPGSPLWRLVRFADDLPLGTAAGVEAALEAANLLDAWVLPADGDFDHDGYLCPLPLSDRPTGPTLADVLHVEEEQDFVSAARVLEILQSISLGSVTEVSAGAPRVDPQGRFVQGVQIGSLAKAAPEFIGATARAHRRSVRLAEYDALLAELAQSRSSLGTRIEAEESTVEAIAQAGRILPAAGPIVTALREQRHAAVVLHGKRENVDAASAQHDDAVAAAGAAETALRRVCAERGVAAEQLDDIAGAVQRFERCADQVIATYRERATAARHADDAAARLDEASEMQAQAEQSLEAVRRKHAAETEQVDTLKMTIDNPEAQAILADVNATEQAIDIAEQMLVATRAADVEAQKAVAAAERDVANGSNSLRVAIQEEQAEAQQLEPFARPDLLELLRCPAHLRWPAELQEGALSTEILALHDAINTATKDLTPTETSLKQTTTRLTRALDELQTELAGAGQDYRPEWTTDAGLFVVRVADEDGYAPIKVFADRITGHRRDQEMLLTDAERRILEDTLLASLARQIHQRTIDARDLVEAMDREMRKRRMSSGVTIGVGWQLADNLDEDQRLVCKLLEKNPIRLSPADLTTMRKHFALRIKAARATRGDRSYRDLLADVLDYRRWRVFAFRLHRPGNSPETLTKARHSQLSGGEQSVSLHLPLFAAAHALFSSAQPGCPRLLALDEAFAGVDETGRAELMALAVQFDLDLFMTGYDLFATHATVPGCAHYELSHSPTEHLVSVLLMVWDGAETLADFDGSLVQALGSPGTRNRSFSVAASAANALSEEDNVLI